VLRNWNCKRACMELERVGENDLTSRGISFCNKLCQTLTSSSPMKH
jgi:hypothetical protein